MFVHYPRLLHLAHVHYLLLPVLTVFPGDFNYIEFIANSKSGQFFFYSHDGRYMIKTQTKEECR